MEVPRYYLPTYQGIFLPLCTRSRNSSQVGTFNRVIHRNILLSIPYIGVGTFEIVPICPRKTCFIKYQAFIETR